MLVLFAKQVERLLRGLLKGLCEEMNVKCLMLYGIMIETELFIILLAKPHIKQRPRRDPPSGGWARRVGGASVKPLGWNLSPGISVSDLRQI